MVHVRTSSRLLALAAAALVVPQAAAQHLPNIAYHVDGHDVIDVAVADVDADGRPDLIVLEAEHDDVSVLRAGDDCRHALTDVEPTGIQATDMDVGDLDEDGFPDVCVTGGSLVRVLFGDGAGGLLPVVSFPIGADARALAVADLDGDGHLDVATVSHAADSVAVLNGDGSGALGPPDVHAVFDEPMSLAVGDVDGDELLDVVTVSRHWPTRISVLLADGLGGFASAVDYDASVVPGWDAARLALGDVDEDGDLDVVVQAGGFSPEGLDLLRNDGSGGFSAPQAVPLSPDGWPKLADLDADGHLDVVAGGWPNGVFLQRGDGAGGFAPPERLYGVAEGKGLVVADMNGDRRDDLVVGGRELVGVLLADAQGGLLRDEPFELLGFDTPRLLVDLDGDGHLDVVCGEPHDDVAVLLADGTGGLLAPVVHPVAGDPGRPTAALLDGDAHLDLLVPTLGGGIAVLLGDGAGGFGPAASHAAGASNLAVAVGDVDEDGHADAIVGANSPWAVLLLRGDGAGGLQPPETLATGAGFGGFPHVLVADVDGDAHLDVITADAAAGDVLVLLGDGAGGFTPAPAPGLSLVPDQLALGDLDGDGDMDLVVAHFTGVVVLLGDGSGAFTPVGLYPDMLPHGLALGDLDGDGVLDVVTALAQGTAMGAVSFMLGDGTGAFRPIRHATANGISGVLALTDDDGDGFLDVVTAGRYTGAITYGWLRNLGGPFVECGAGLPGTHGTPRLSATGTFEGGSTVTLTLEDALGSSTAWLVAGIGTLLAPLKGGTLVPQPTQVFPPIPLGPSGSLFLSGPFPVGLPPGIPLALQLWIPDPAGPVGFAATDGMVGITP